MLGKETRVIRLEGARISRSPLFVEISFAALSARLDSLVQSAAHRTVIVELAFQEASPSSPSTYLVLHGTAKIEHYNVENCTSQSPTFE